MTAVEVALTVLQYLNLGHLYLTYKYNLQLNLSLVIHYMKKS